MSRGQPADQAQGNSHHTQQSLSSRMTVSVQRSDTQDADMGSPRRNFSQTSARSIPRDLGNEAIIGQLFEDPAEMSESYEPGANAESRQFFPHQQPQQQHEQHERSHGQAYWPPHSRDTGYNNQHEYFQQGQQNYQYPSVPALTQGLESANNTQTLPAMTTSMPENTQAGLTNGHIVANGESRGVSQRRTRRNEVTVHQMYRHSDSGDRDRNGSTRNRPQNGANGQN